MSLILAIETSSASGSVALCQDGLILRSQHYHLDKSHSSVLHTMVKDLMHSAKEEMSDLDAIAVSKGPGSYTGLRIGASTAKGLCFALDIPLIGINTLESMAHQVVKKHTDYDLYCPMLDARRMEVYSLMVDGDLNMVSETQPVILDEYSYAEKLKENKITFFGDGSDKFKDVVDHPNANFIDDVTPSAEDIALLAQIEFEKGHFENVIDFEPFYLKEYRIIPSKK